MPTDLQDTNSPRFYESVPVSPTSRRPKLRQLIVGALITTGMLYGTYGWKENLTNEYLGSLLPLRGVTSPWNEPIAQSWPVAAEWNSRLEDEYAQFIEHLGQAVAQHHCQRLDSCLRDKDANLLFDPLSDPKLALDVDCGDLPYVLRGYFSFKRRLPFGFVCDVHGTGNDIRYMAEVTPARFCSWQSYKSPHAVLRQMSGEVHSGMFRMAPEIENADFYPAAMNRDAVRPGTIYYDPNGHVLTVAEVAVDGTVHLIDGHPDGSLTWTRFGQSLALGGHSQGGGFKNFRPLRLVDKELVRTPNRELPWFDGTAQWDRALWAASAPAGTYYTWVRKSLAVGQLTPDPVNDFRDQLVALCRDISDRVESVQQAVEAGLPTRSQPRELPWNIYGTGGDWEMYASPSRDARLKAAFRELHETAAALSAESPLRATLRTVWTQQSAQPSCRFVYRNSLGKPVELTLDEIIERLFRMSFDAYHCPELRWGAPPGSQEAASCPDDAAKRDFYAKEQRLRNRIDRDYGAPTPLTDGPEDSPDLDVRRLLPP